MVKGEFCLYKPSLFCQESSGCSNCMIAHDSHKFTAVTHVHCTHCGWSGKVEDCSHTEHNEVIDGSLESYTIDLCPECREEVEYS